MFRGLISKKGKEVVLQFNPYFGDIEIIYKMSYSYITDNGMLKIFSFFFMD